MSEPARNRFALDLEDLERQLRGAAQTPKPGQASDPLAELTRIVGRDDPLKDLFPQRGQPALVHPQPVAPVQPQAASGWQVTRQEPSFSAAAPEPENAPPAEVRGALDEFEALLRRTDAARPAPVAAPAEPYRPSDAQGYAAPEPQPYQQPVAAQAGSQAPRDLDEEAGSYDYAYVQPNSHEPAYLPPVDEDDAPELEPRRSRKGLWVTAALLVVGVAGVGAAMTFRSSTASKDGLPPVISADRAPIKVEPANPGGTEVPNQNKQIYEKAGQAQPAQTKVVSREEQPIDVQQAARTLPARVVLAGPGADATSNPLANAPAAPDRGVTPAEPALTPMPAVPGLGEPRRVRTVAIKPDGTPAAAPATNGIVAAPQTTASAPTRLGGLPATAMTMPPATSPQKPRQAATPELPKAQERVATPAPATTPSAPVRVASAAPTATAPAANAPRAGSGDFAVQLGAPGSEAEARATFAALQRKYPGQLSGQSPIVRKTELAGGKTVYRLRVGPYSRDDATTLCTQLQSAGGQCFIAKN